MTLLETTTADQYRSTVPAEDAAETPTAGHRRAAQERLAAFNRLFTERHRPLVHLAIGLVDQPAVAEEIVQEAFQRVWTRWDGLDAPSVYLRTAVVNGCHDELRRRRVRRRHDPTLRPPVPAEAHYLVDALASVERRRREALILRYWGGHTVPEVAKAMGIPTGTAKSLIHRGLADLRGAFGEILGAPVAGSSAA